MRRRILSVVFLLVGLVAIGGLMAASLDPAQEWLKSKHANRETAIAEATVESRGPLAAHCARCHSEQGFLAWLPQLMAGNPGLIVDPNTGKPAEVPYLTQLGLTKEKVQPITCTVCHGEGFALRVKGSTPMLPAGFAAAGVGDGAMCMTCHNTRNGRIQWDSSDPKRYTGPHEAAQADVIMGKNVYFLNDTAELVSPHAAFVGDSCVTCHKTLGKEGHTFEPSETVCASCHGAAMKIEFVQEPTKHLLEQLRVAIEKKVLAARDKIKVVTAWDPKTDKDTPDTPIDATQIKSVDLLTIRGQLAFKFIMADGAEVYSQIGNVKDAPGEAGKPVFATSDPIVRAAHNYMLVVYDGSMGVHNPKFVRDVLLTTIRAMAQ
jgi:hypothetical protein